MAYIGQQPVNTFSPVPSKDSFTGDGSTTTFDLGNSVVSGGQNALEVFVNNVRQEPGSGKAFTLGQDGSGDLKRITFSAAPASGASIYVINDKTSSTSTITPSDLNGAELILDADADSSITADTDDRIDFKLANTDHIQLGTSSGDTTIKIATDAKDLQFLQADGNKLFEINDGNFVGVGGNSAAPGEIRIFEDTDNGSHYTGFKAGNNTASVAYVLPTADGVAGTSLTTDGSGTLSWSASLSIANDGNNRITTATGSSGLNGEANLQFDGSTLAVTGATTISTNLDVDGTTNLDAVDIDGAVQIDATLSVGVDDTGYDVKLFGDTASAFMLWDASADDLILSGAAGLIVPDGQFTLGSTAVTSTAAELNLLDGVSGLVQADLTKLAAVDSTATELNIIDGNATVGTTAVADGDGIVTNDGGTMRQTTVQTFATYFASEITAMSNLVTTGALDSGSITSGFGNIDNGASNITSGGLLKLDVDTDADDVSGDSATGRLTLGANEDLNLYHGGTHSYIVNDTGNLIIDTAGDLVFDASGNDFKFFANGTEILNITNSSSDVVIKPLVDTKDIIFQQRDGTEVARIEDNATFNVTTDGKFAIAGTAVTSTAAELNLLDGVSGLVQADLTKLAAVDSTAAEINILDGVTSTAAEINIIDGNTSATSTTLVDADRVVVNDNGTMVQVAMTDIKTYIGGGTEWQAIKTGAYTASAGQGVFVNTTSSAFAITLPASPSLGDEVTIVDYAGTFDSNACTIGRNSQPIQGVAEDLVVSTERASFTLVYVDSTQGWLFKND
jgi:hypothetical protein